MDLRVVRVRHRIGEEVPVMGVLANVVPQGSQQGPVEALCLPVALRMVRRREQVLDSEESTDVLEKPFRKLLSVLRQERCRRTVDKNPMCYERFCDAQCGERRKRDCPNKLRESVRNDEQVSVPSRSLDQFTEDVQCHELQWSGSEKQRHRLRVPPQPDTITGAVGATPGDRIAFHRHRRPVEVGE